ncbi:4-alpha-glucanotransferase [Polyangium jinanense]|uniref:4-alpha-glucanotransferase n=1 Tax=Polyangium jinanense TaxID=2829994 RepID=A0A9X3XE20_9BACT|nr:4-alpha-glucanotransferase [Polyangium jinanense]MDC3961935.1 4-alpha-glucanotransferase [Polyangium jinanense]MDC3988664.1 4-alpha-glucanotransferase [Polyangium jinanense]
MNTRAEERHLAGEALRLLGKERLALAIHDPSFPADPDEDIGRGSPYGRASARFFRFARDLGFTAVLLGPQGDLSEGNASPYDGACFSRATVSIALAPLARDPAWGGLLRPETLASLVADRPRSPAGRAHHRYASAAVRRALDEAFAAFQEKRRFGSLPPTLAAFAARLDAWRARNIGWIERDALYERLAMEHSLGHFKDWPALDARLFAPSPGDEAAAAARWSTLRSRYAETIEAHAFRQLLAREEHAALRAHLASLDLALYGDLAVGLGLQDEWSNLSIFLSGYRMGAPPSRTNPEGQPWGYPVLDPALWPGAAGEFLRARMTAMFEAYDGVRIDHPHGLVDPWVYDAAAEDPLVAVQRGARLRSSPDLSDHPRLAAFAIPHPSQIDGSLPRHAEAWVRDLDAAQVGAYGKLLDVLVEAAEVRGHVAKTLFCEVLSTLPGQLEAVLARHGLGRFRVTQKANLDDPRDVYRSENAEPADWIMMGTHDTPSMWELAATWRAEGKLAAQASYLARRLGAPALEAAVLRDPGMLVAAKLADALASNARSAMLFFADLFGLRERYNVPGTISDDNWSLRVPEGWETGYFEARRRGEALDLRQALALALRARASGAAGDLETLAARLSALP